MRTHVNATSDCTQPGRGRDDRMRMRTILVLILGLGAACGTKPNPEVCCTSVDQCAAIGVSDGLRPCGGAGQVCTPAGLCVASECDVNTDCTDAASPICIAHECVAKCVIDADCMDPAAAKCDSDGVCVACVENAQCTTDTAPTCDATAHTCRACAADADCDSGVCLEFSGECAATARLIIVSPNGASNGQCDATHPCLTVADAMALVTGQRDVIRIVDGKVQTGMPTIGVPSVDQVVVDGDASAAIGAGSGSAVFKVEQGATLTLEEVAISGVLNARITVIDNLGGVVLLNRCAFAHAGFVQAIGTLTLTSNVLSDFSSSQADGVLVLRSNQATGFGLTVSGGTVNLIGNRLAGGSGIMRASGARLSLENNLITSADSFADALDLRGAAAGSKFRFNTMINTSGVDNGASYLSCDSSTAVASNIIAWNTSGSPQCVSTFSLYDAFVTNAGSGNQTGDVNTFFVDYLHQDYRLSPASPALAHGDPTATDVTTDIDGNARPNPAGSAPDVGAFEAP